MRTQRTLQQRFRAYMLAPPTRELELLLIVTAMAVVLTLLLALLLR
jgi:hypothetical protein